MAANPAASRPSVIVMAAKVAGNERPTSGRTSERTADTDGREAGRKRCAARELRSVGRPANGRRAGKTPAAKEIFRSVGRSVGWNGMNKGEGEGEGQLGR